MSRHDRHSIRDEGEGLCRDLPSRPVPEIGTVLVSGSTGYIGGRLVPELLHRGYRVRAMVRAASPEHRERWPDAEVVAGDALDPDTLTGTFEGVHTAYYLIHSLLLGPDNFESADIDSAVNFLRAAEAAGVKRIIYLGGLGDMCSHLSSHLRSRMQVGEALQSGTVEATILRAAVIIGSGSASYEIIKHLVSRLPVICVPYWARTQCQPIGVRDVVRYLVGTLEVEDTAGHTYDIGGRDVLTYESMMRVLASLLGKHRLFVRMPFSHIGTYSYIGSLLTPVPATITQCLMEGLTDDVVCQNDGIRRLLPFEPLSYREAIVDAMTREEQDRVHTRWSDAYPPAHELAVKLAELPGPAKYTVCHSLLTRRPEDALFTCICSIGGKEGWFHHNWMWRMRGMVDRILMGVGTSRGRRSATTLRVNDVVDFWRVENIRPNEMLLLRAEMKLPGMGWLRFNITPVDDHNHLTVTAYYETGTLLGKLYWYAFVPFHFTIFTSLLKQIDRRSAVHE